MVYTTSWTLSSLTFTAAVFCFFFLYWLATHSYGHILDLCTKTTEKKKKQQTLNIWNADAHTPTEGFYSFS